MNLYQSVRAAAAALEEPSESQMFNPWPLEEPLEFLEKALKARKAGLKRIYDSGLSDILLCEEDVYGFERWEPSVRLTLFRFARQFAKGLSLILDKVERDPQNVPFMQLMSVMTLWSERLEHRVQYSNLYQN